MPLFICYLVGMLNPDSTSIMTPSAYFASTEMGTVYVFMCFGIMILASKVMSGDASDKTINYELMAGHSRDKVFAGRVIASILWGGVLVFVFMLLPLGYLTLFNGWGVETNSIEVLLRSILTLFPIIRFAALTIMVASISRSAGKGIALSYAIFMVTATISSVLQDIFEIDLNYSFSMTNAATLLSTQNSWYEVIDGKSVCIFDTSVSGDMIWKTIVVSLIAAAIYLTIAYINFKKTDRD
jgi:ABC-type transport system involved in multi-copper enzyme maturation permease subunit